MNDDEITSEHTYARIAQVLEEIECLRLEMGRNKDTRRPLLVREASAREVFYHAQTIHRKANQLCVELGAESVHPPTAASTPKLLPADVLRVLDGTRARLAEARSRLGAEEPSVRPELPGPVARVKGKTSSDVLAACLVASRQLSGLLTTAFTSREGCDLLLAALRSLELLLARHDRRLPPPPPLERRKFPRDVYGVLWEAYELLHKIMHESGVRALELRERFAGEEPSDVYDLASLIVSELEYICALLSDLGAATLDVRPPPITLPSHNYRYAVQMRTAIASLEEAVRPRLRGLAVAASP